MDKQFEGNSFPLILLESKEPEDLNIIVKTNAPSQQRSHRQVKSVTKEPPAKYYCKIHLDKPIEYFCSKCNMSVCSKCMFLHHNGHDLSQLDDALKLMLTKLNQFDEKVQELISDSDETRQTLLNSKIEIEKLREKQQSMIDSKFKELMAKLEERKN